MKKLVFCAILLLSTTAANSKVLDDSGAKIGGELVNAITKAAQKIVRDPESILLSDLVMAKHDSVVCGHINAKNGFGGYVGSKPFVYHVYQEDITIYQGHDEPNMDRLIQLTFNYSGCTKALNLPFAMEED